MAETMMEADRGIITQRVKTNLAAAEVNLKQLRAASNRLMFTSIVSSATTTVITGWTAAQGPIMGSGPAGWRFSCILGTVFGFISTVTIGVTQQFKVSERLAKATEGVGRLKALDLAIALGNRPWIEITRDYEELLRSNPDLEG